MTASTLTDTTAISCPKCGGQMFDNRLSKKNPKAPDFKCRKRTCEGVIWPPKNGAPPVAQTTANANAIADPVKKPTMREAYKHLTQWVIDEVAPIYGDELDQNTIAAITATLFIQACNAGKVE